MGLLGGAGVVIARVIAMVAIPRTLFRVLMALLSSTLEPPSRA